MFFFLCLTLLGTAKAADEINIVEISLKKLK